MIELTSTRVDKSTKLSLAPKLKPRTGNRNAKPVAKPAEIIAQESKDSGDSDDLIVPPPAPTPSATPKKLDIPGVAPITKVQPSNVNFIQIPSSLPVPTCSPSLSNEPNTPQASSIKQLISNKFENGQLSKYEVNRRLQLKEKRKRKAEQVPSVVVPIKSKEDPNQTMNLPSGPKVRIVNGEMQIDASSLVVESSTNINEHELTRVEEGAMRFVSSASFRAKPLTARVRWSPEMTDRFYQGLGYFGTDFGLVSLLFPDMTRNQIKLKFNAEERNNSARVTQALNNRQVPDEITRNRMKALLMKNKEKAGTSNNMPSAVSIPTKEEIMSGLRDVKPNIESDTESESDEELNNSPEQLVAPQDIAEATLQQQTDQAFQEALVTSSAASTLSKRPLVGPKVGPRPNIRPRKAVS